ncbi:hypothetical protein AFK62_08835 [Cronobacter condimenti 1330]|uniref:Fido domain-containing protein n=1 Tax=Cronobacter condimenti 1330 TaxID=1073999 RepID=A0ABM5VCK3_9ENTR|nr:Fic family protein [Cronobacter condimenti]ALB62597.1 hypothetical protein AFK62_08835 [Cronobacter condimenti 1330]
MLKPSDYAKAEGYNELTHAIGSGPAGQLIAHTVRALGVEDKEMLGNLLKVECKKLAKLAGHFERLRPAHPGAANTEQTQEQAIEDAAQWIAGASNSAAISAPLIKSYLNHYLTFDFSISSIVDVDELHRRVAPGASTTPRGIVPNDTPVPSSFSGRELFSQQLAKRAVSDHSPLYPQSLFAWITGWHPFPDGNGRTARAAYAITAIRNGTWRRLSKADEDLLSGL